MRIQTLSAWQGVVEPCHLEDIKLASAKMFGANRRAFQAEMALKYCGGLLG